MLFFNQILNQKYIFLKKIDSKYNDRIFMYIMICLKTLNKNILRINNEDFQFLNNTFHVLIFRVQF